MTSKTSLILKRNYFFEQQELAKFYRFRSKTPQDEGELSDSINFLAELLYRLHDKPVYILVDEYDVRHESAKVTSSCECYRKSATEHILYQNLNIH
jgi:hypothetical protein